MRRRSLSLLILAILLCCHGWAAVMQDVLLAQASMTDGAAQQQIETTSSADQGNNGAGQQHDSASGQSDLEDFPIAGRLDFTSAAVQTAERHDIGSFGNLPFRWLECPMRPPCQAALLT
jgi:hypothetical protein